MTRAFDSSTIDKMVEVFDLINEEPVRKLMEIVFNNVMLAQRERHNNAGDYERSLERLDSSNGFKKRSLNTRVGRLELKVPQTRSGEFYPACLEKGCRTERSLKLAWAEMYVNGVSTRNVESIMYQMAEMDVSSSMVSRCSKELDTQLENWRNRSLGVIPYLYLDARYEKVRVNGTVRDMAILSAIGIDSGGQRQVLGISTSLSEAEVHWAKFLESLIERGLHGVQLIISDDHSGLGKARRKHFGGVKWQRCLFHLQQNAQKHCSKKSHRKEIAQDIRNIYKASDKSLALQILKQVLEKWKTKDPKLAEWLELAIHEGLTFFDFPSEHWVRIRTNNSTERYNKELAKRTKSVGVFPSEDSLLRLASALASEISDDWISGRKYLNMDKLIQEKE